VETVQSERTDKQAKYARRPSSGDVVGRLLRTAAQIATEQARLLRHASLSPSAFTVLLNLADAPGERLQPCMLASRLSVSRPSMCGLIDGLQAKGLVTRAPHGRDGRRVLVELSASGRQLLDDHRASYDAMLDTLLADLTDSDCHRLVGLLLRIGPRDPVS
jgi:DNA-binding MarR family transcriptional regulator